MTIDLVAHFPATDHSYNTIYTVINRLSKFTYFILCKHIISATDLALLFLANLVAHHGMPASITSSRGPQYTSHFWHSLISALDCEHSLSMDFHLEIDSLSERIHRFIE